MENIEQPETSSSLEKYEIQILDQKLTIKSDDGKDHVKEVEYLVNSKMKEIVEGNKAISTSNVAMLAALTLADEFVKMRDKNKSNTKKWIENINQLIEEVENLEITRKE